MRKKHESWKEWKNRQVEECPPRERKSYRRLLNSIPSPLTKKERKAVDEAGKAETRNIQRLAKHLQPGMEADESEFVEFDIEKIISQAKSE